MKKLAVMVALMMAVSGSVYAGGVSPSKNTLVYETTFANKGCPAFDWRFSLDSQQELLACMQANKTKACKKYVGENYVWDDNAPYVNDEVGRCVLA